MKKALRSPYLYAALALIVALVLVDVLRSGSDTRTIGLGTYQRDLGSGQVVSATVHDSSDTITGKLADGSAYRVEYPDRLTDTLVPQISKAVAPSQFKVDHSHSSVWSGVLSTYLPMVVLVGLFLLVLNSAGGGKLLKFGKTKARTYGKDQPAVTFADVAGADEAVAELQEIKEFLESPSRFHALGAKIPRGVLLFGPPGTGKTLLARAVAGEAGVPFFSISGSDFVEMFVGVGASRVRDLFQQAKASAPSIVFVDEIDAVGRHRGSGNGGGHDEREQTLNQLLVELDGFDARGGVILIAATNRPDILDPALLRPGRFDRHIVVDRPDVIGRRHILDVHAKGKPLHQNVNLEVLSKRTPGFSGADLANLLNEAALLAARRNLRQVGMRECEEAIDRVMAGPERKTLIMSDHDKLVTAYHEGGHVLVGHVLRHADPIHKVSIVARSRSLGLTFTLPEDKYNHSRSELRDAMAMCLGGRSAEELVFLEPTTGAENDIEKATRIARAMVTEYGMSDLVGPQALGSSGGSGFLGRETVAPHAVSDHNAALVDSEVRALIDGAHQRALAILHEHRGVLDDLARELVEKETLEGPDLMAVIGHLDAWPDLRPVPLPGAVTPRPAKTAKPSAPKTPRPARATLPVAPGELPAVATGAGAPRTGRSRAAKPLPALESLAETAKGATPEATDPLSRKGRAGAKDQPGEAKAQPAGRVRPRPRPKTTD